MAKGRAEFEWGLASSIAAAALNANPFREKAVKPDELNPFSNRKEQDEDVFGMMERDGFFKER